MQVCVRALPSVYKDCAVSMSLRRKRNQLTCFETSKSARSPDAWLQIAPPSSVSAVSASASLPRPCLPRADVLGEGVATGVGVEGIAAGGWVRVLAAGGGWVI